MRALLKVSDIKIPDEQVVITRQDAVRFLSERINVSISVSNVLEIGLNAQIDYENCENVWFEKVFNFYSQLEIAQPPLDESNVTVDYKPLNNEPDRYLRMRSKFE